MKTLVAGVLVAATMAVALPEPASAFGVYVGPAGGVRVGIGRPFGYRGGYRYGYGYRRPFVGRPFIRRGYRRY